MVEDEDGIRTPSLVYGHRSFYLRPGEPSTLLKTMKDLQIILFKRRCIQCYEWCSKVICKTLEMQPL